MYIIFIFNSPVLAPPSTVSDNDSNLFHLRLIFPVLEFYINGVITFCAGLLLFIIMPMRFSQVVAHISNSFFFIAESYPTRMRYHNFFVYILLLDVWVVLRFGLLGIKELWTLFHKNFDTDFHFSWINTYELNWWVKRLIHENIWTYFTLLIKNNKNIPKKKFWKKKMNLYF